MPLVKDQIPLPLVQGIDTYTDPKHNQGLTTSKNVYIDNAGAVKRRPGLTEVTSSLGVQSDYRNSNAVLSSGVALHEWASNPLVIAGDEYSRTVNGVSDVLHAESGMGVFLPVSTEADTDWALIGETRHLKPTMVKGPTQAADQQSVGYARIGAFECWGWVRYAQSWAGITFTEWAVHNTATGAWYGFGSQGHGAGSTDVQLYIGVATESDSSDDKFVIVSCGLANYTFVVDPETGASSAGPTLTSSVDKAVGCCQGTEGAKTVVIVASDNAGTLRLSKLYGDSTMAREQDVNVTLNDGTNDFMAVTQLTGDDAYIAVYRAAQASDAAYLYVFPTDYGNAESAIASLTVDSAQGGAAYLSFGVVGGEHADVAYSGTTGTHSIYITSGREHTDTSTYMETEVYFVEFDADAGPPATLTLKDSWEIHGLLPGRPFIEESRVFVPMHAGNNIAESASSLITANRVFLLEMRVDDTPALYGVPVAMLLPTDSAALDTSVTTQRFEYQSWTDSIGSVVTARRQAQVVGVDTDADTPVVQHSPVAFRLDFNPAPPQFAKSGEDLIISGPILRHVDGLCQEVGFLLDPELVRMGTTGTGLTGDFGCTYIFEWADRLGQRHRSVPAESNVETLANTTPVYYIFPPRFMGDFGASGAAYAKSGSVNAVAFRTKEVTSGANHYRSESESLGENWVASNDYYKQTVDDADAVLADNELLYTDAGILPNLPPPGGGILLSHKDRVLVVPYHDPQTIWVSHERVPGVGLSFSEDLAVSMRSGGDVTGLGALDDYYIVFTADSVHAFGGQGPNVLGVGGFSPMTRISSNVGCRDPNSVVSFDGGVLFKSSSGWQLLDRSLTVKPIGLPVRAYDAHVVHRAVVNANTNTIRVLHDPSDDTTQLEFNYLHQVWQEIDLASGFESTQTIVDIAVIDGTIYHLGDNGTVWTETAAAAADDSQAFTCTLTTGWVTNELHDFQRISKVKLVGDWAASGNLVLTYYYDYSAVSGGSTTVNMATINADGVLWVKPPRAACKAFRMTITGAFDEVSQVSLEVGRRPGRMGRTTNWS
jgi:hypothetical protein